MEQETFYLIDVPGGDRRYIARDISPERYEQLKRDYPGMRVFKVVVDLPLGKNHDTEVKASAVEWRGEFGDAQ